MQYLTGQGYFSFGVEILVPDTEYPNLHSESELRDCAVAGNQISFLDVNLDGGALRIFKISHHHICLARIFL